MDIIKIDLVDTIFNIKTNPACVKITLFFTLFIFQINNLFTQQSDDVLLKRSKEFTPLQVITGDTLVKERSADSRTALPGGALEIFSPEQDSAYFNDLRLNIPVSSRIELSLDLHSRKIMERILAEQSKGFFAAQSNLASIPRELFIPSSREKFLYDYNLKMAQTVPFVSNPSDLGLKVPLSDIGAILGITEDVSPVINYKLDYAVEVEIVVYSLNAAVIATLFEGVQPAGNYTITWNGRDDKGRKVPSGDYVAEVRIGKQKFIRKRILIP